LEDIWAPAGPLSDADNLRAEHRIQVSEREQAGLDSARRQAIEQEQQQDYANAGAKKPPAVAKPKPLRKPRQRNYSDQSPVYYLDFPMMPEYWIGPVIHPGK
jgi:hypothetical protein